MKVLNFCTTFAWAPAFIFALHLSACSTPAGKQAKRDSVAIGKNTTAIKQSNDSATVENANAQKHVKTVQDLDAQVDAKDRVIEQYFRQHEINR